MRLFLDTCVLIDYYAQREPFAADANRLRVAEAFGDAELWTAPQSYMDILYILRRAIPAADLRQQLHASLAFLHVCGTESADLSDALESSWEDSEDFLIARCAEKAKADFLITRDKTHFVEAKTRVLSPSEFLLMMEGQGIEYEDVDLDHEGVDRDHEDMDSD